MPPQPGKSAVSGLLKQTVGKSFDTHKTDDTVIPGGGNLPDGIEQGVAQLTEINFAQYKDGENKGKLYCQIVGIVVAVGPGEPNCIGQRATRMIGLHATKPRGKAPGKTVDDMVAALLNEFRLLGCDTSQLTVDDLEDAALALVQEDVHFKFRTWKGKATPAFPNPRVTVTFMGKDANYTPGASTGEAGGVDDNSGQAGEAAAGEPSLADLGEAADNGDEEAAKKLQELGAAHGIDTDKAENWVSAAAEIESAMGGDGSGDTAGDTGEQAEPWKPAVKDVYPFKPKGARKPIDVEITQVFSSTVSAKGVTDGKPYKGIPWTSEPPTLGGVAIS